MNNHCLDFVQTLGWILLVSDHHVDNNLKDILVSVYCGLIVNNLPKIDVGSVCALIILGIVDTTGIKPVSSNT